MPIAMSANRTSATTAKTTPGPANRVAAQPPSKASAGQDHADRRDRGAQRLERRQRLAAEDDREHDRQPAVRGDHPADDRDRPDPEAGEVRQVGAGADQPEERRERDRRAGSVGRLVPVTTARRDDHDGRRRAASRR